MATNNTGVDFDNDVAHAVTDLTDSFTWSGTAYNAVISQINRGIVIDGIEGPADEIAFEIVVRTSLFSGSRPTSGDNVTISSTDYRIDRVETDEADAALNIICVSDIGR